MDAAAPIAVTIDERTARLLEELAEDVPELQNRSLVVRKALREFAERERRRIEEERESRVLRRHRGRLRREAQALVKSQARA